MREWSSWQLAGLIVRASLDRSQPLVPFYAPAAGGFRSLRKPLGDGFIFNPNQPAIKCNNTKPALTGTT